MLVVSTASAYKFASDVLLSITGEKPDNDLDAPALLQRLTGTELPKPLSDALAREPVHTDVYGRDKYSLAEAVFSFATDK